MKNRMHSICTWKIIKNYRNKCHFSFICSSRRTYKQICINLQDKPTFKNVQTVWLQNPSLGGMTPKTKNKIILLFSFFSLIIIVYLAKSLLGLSFIHWHYVKQRTWIKVKILLSCCFENNPTDLKTMCLKASMTEWFNMIHYSANIR